MERPRWDRIKQIYESALSKPVFERSSFLTLACDQDPVLIREVSLMLQTADSIRGFLEKPLFEMGLRIIGSNSFPVTENLVGTTIDGRYLLEQELGRGGIGTVYLARDQQLHNRRVVIKILLQSSLLDPYVVKKFKHEVEALSRVNHPGVVGLLGAGTLSDGKPYLVMQYVSGPTLRSEITTSGMDLSRVASIVRQLGVALDDIHDKGILHRDLKPENIMLQRLNDGTELVKIVDFGIAKVNDSAIDSATSHRATLGTVLYSSPEQVRGDRLLVGSDIYSMAVIAYELVAGRRPFIASTASQLLELQRAGVRVLPVELRSDITHDVQSVILKALSFNSCDRYRRAGDFGHRLGSALEKNAHETRSLDGWRLRIFEGSLALLVCGAALLGISRYGRPSEIPEK